MNDTLVLFLLMSAMYLIGFLSGYTTRNRPASRPQRETR